MLFGVLWLCLIGFAIKNLSKMQNFTLRERINAKVPMTVPLVPSLFSGDKEGVFLRIPFNQVAGFVDEEGN
jgi:hypothetical protein